ncbi:Outer membrane lipoprotein carrier protein LolA [hydrothermal vent metagenome]|uniref:Outer membrane lipoprotein carrier protein LolA n=1 Tax=hydrothermal vent metagenome TaxID=652676 RepID=A0A1W1BDG1_9ZZZZ
MLIQKIRYFFIYLIFSATFLYGQSILSLPNSFKADFQQIITSDNGKKITYNGSILFSSPKQFKWSYKSPTQKDICTDNAELIVVDHDLEQVSRFVIDRGLNLSAILANAKERRESVYIASYGGKSYTIQVDRKNQLSRIAYKDDLDNNVLIIFSHMRYNKKSYSSKKMRCRVPASYDKIEE